MFKRKTTKGSGNAKLRRSNYISRAKLKNKKEKRRGNRGAEVRRE